MANFKLHAFGTTTLHSSLEDAIKALQNHVELNDIGSNEYDWNNQIINIATGETWKIAYNGHIMN